MTAEPGPAYQMTPIAGEKLLLDRVADQIRAAILGGAFAPGSRNSRIKEELDKLRSQLVLLSRATSTTPGGMDQSVIDAHEAIVTAIDDGDPSEADHAARAHVRGVLYLHQGRPAERQRARLAGPQRPGPGS